MDFNPWTSIHLFNQSILQSILQSIQSIHTSIHTSILPQSIQSIHSVHSINPFDQTIQSIHSINPFNQSILQSIQLIHSINPLNQSIQPIQSIHSINPFNQSTQSIHSIHSVSPVNHKATASVLNQSIKETICRPMISTMSIATPDQSIPALLAVRPLAIACCSRPQQSKYSRLERCRSRTVPPIARTVHQQNRGRQYPATSSASCAMPILLLQRREK